MVIKHINELKTILINELKTEHLNEKALNEIWNVLNSPSNNEHEVTKEHLINYYTTCLRFEQLKDNI
jgi:hypothetical protein